LDCIPVRIEHACSGFQPVNFDMPPFRYKLAQMIYGMNLKIRLPGLVICLLMVSSWPGWSQGVATVWDGPVITFNHPAGTGTSVRDELTPNVWLTRNDTEGLFNVALEGAYTHFSSPQDTEWAYGLLADYAALSYSSWEQWNGKYPPGMVGQPAVVHLISENIYLALTFTSWGERGGLGQFSYERSTPSAVPEPSVCALLGLSGLIALAFLIKRKSIFFA
jgi:hypothetical protein